MNNEGYVVGEYESPQEKLLEVIRSVNKDKTLIEKIVNTFSEDSELKEYVLKEWETPLRESYDSRTGITEYFKTRTHKYKVFAVNGNETRKYKKTYEEYYLKGVRDGTTWNYTILNTEDYLKHYREYESKEKKRLETSKKQKEEYDKKYPYGKDFHNVWKDFI